MNFFVSFRMDLAFLSIIKIVLLLRINLWYSILKIDDLKKKKSFSLAFLSVKKN